MSMLLDINESVIDSTVPFQKCLGYAIFAAFVYLFRPSEFIMTKNSEGRYHFIREQDVTFTIKDINGVESIIASSEAHLYANRFYKNKWNVLVDVMVSVRDAKNDPNGVGNRYTHDIESVQENRAFCIATVMFENAILCRPKRDYPFFSCPHQGWKLSEKNVADAIKASAKFFFSDKLVVEKFTPRSLRVGGASALMASGSPDSYIQKAGRWKSSTFLDYLRVCAVLTQKCTAQMCKKGSGFTAKDILTRLPLPVGAISQWN